jgi:preprotein translocase subunit Sec61beta
MPATGAGLLRFYSESDSPGIKIGPYVVMALSIGMIAVILAAFLIQKAGPWFLNFGSLLGVG